MRAELRIARTAAGDDVLELAADGLLSPSIGFQSSGGEDWTADRTAVKVTRAKLVHIALTGDPAYKGAKVLAVRTADGDTGRGWRHRTWTGSGWRCLPPVPASI